jgi:hypothetical protein
MGGHYEVYENGRIIPIAGDGNCGFVAFFRAVTGMLPNRREIAAMRGHAANELDDEQIENILAAQDEDDVDMQPLAMLSIAYELEAQAEAPVDEARDQPATSSQPASAPPKTGEPESSDPGAKASDPSASDDSGPEAQIVQEDFEDGLAEFFRLQDPAIEQAVESEMSASSSSQEQDASDSESGAEGHGPQPNPDPDPDPDPHGGHGGSPGPARGPAPAIQIDPSQVKVPKTKHGVMDAVDSFVDKTSGTTGNVGYSGTNNFGGTDQAFHGVTSGLESDKGHAITGGTSDAVSAINSTVSATLVLRKAIDTLKDKKASDLEKVQAVTDIGSSSMKIVQSYNVLEGGLLTTLEGSGTIKDKSNFGFTAEGGNALSTDFKLAGDAAGLLGDAIGLVSTGLDAINNYEKLVKGSKAEAVGRVSLTVGKALGSLGKMARTLGQLIGQIQNHGQMAADFGGQAFKTFGGQVIPLAGAGFALANIGRQAYNVHKFRKRRAKLKLLLQNQALTAKQAEAVAFIRTNLKKRIVRASIDIGLSSVEFVSGVLQAATPIGTATGTAINATTSAVRLGMVATRVIKQKLRDHVADKRKKTGKDESYEQWAARQKAKGVKGKVHAFVQPNWDKSTAEKRKAYIEHAITIIEMDSAEVYASIGLDQKALAKLAPKPAKERVEAIIKQLQKR